MKECPFCGSEDIYFSRKRKVFVCEDCDKTFYEQQCSNKTTMESTDKGLELFFSYGHDKNRLLVERIKRDLEKRGHHVWIDTSEIKAGDHWRDDILNGVLKSSGVIAFLSEHSTRNPGVCLDELKIAVCVKGTNVKTVLLEPENRIQPPATLSEIQWLDMSNWYELKKSSVTDFEDWYKDKFAELCRVIESSESVELSGDIHTLKTKLSPYLNSEKEYKLLSKEFYGRRWIEDYIEEWQDRRSTKVLMLYGNPGSGKSAFSVNYSHYNSDVYGCFLCEWNREYTIDPHHLIRTMAFRLAAKLPDYRRMLLLQLDNDVCLEKMNSEALFDYLLTYPLSHLIDGNRETGIIIVDGLDEAEKNGENPLAEVFAKCAECLPRWIRFVFTSRPEKNVIKYFKSSETLDIVGDMPKGYNDIMAYLIKSMAEQLRQISNKLELLNKICNLSDGIFLYAELLVTDIKNGFIKLSDIDIFPKGLNAFYFLSMKRKFANVETFEIVRGVLELLSVSDSIPEKLVYETLGQTKYTFIKCIDMIGSWISQYEEDGIDMIGFSHKSLKDWLVNKEQSCDFYVDYKLAALKLARYCRKCIECNFRNINAPKIKDYIKRHIGNLYIISEQYTELEEFMRFHTAELDPYWRVLDQFPESWDNNVLLDLLWHSTERNAFLKKIQREGNATFLLWIFDIAEKMYGINQFDNELVSVYIDIVHISGKYDKAVHIADQYLMGKTSEIAGNQFLSMLSVRRLHHSMFYKPTANILDQAVELSLQLDDRFPTVYNELLFLIGGNLGILYGDWKFCKKWLDKSVAYAEKYGLSDFKKRNARKMADYYCHMCEYEKAENILKENFSVNGQITGRYEAYIVGALANIHTCTGDDDEALGLYEKLLKYTAMQGIPGWNAHANLGIGNVNFKLGNLKEAVDFATRAKIIYNSIHQEWGIIMSDALLAACQSRIGIAPIRVACDKAIKRAQRMQYGSCVSSIKELCDGSANFLKLYFL